MRGNLIITISGQNMFVELILAVLNYGKIARSGDSCNGVILRTNWSLCVLISCAVSDVQWSGWNNLSWILYCYVSWLVKLGVDIPCDMYYVYRTSVSCYQKRRNICVDVTDVTVSRYKAQYLFWVCWWRCSWVGVVVGPVVSRWGWVVVVRLHYDRSTRPSRPHPGAPPRPPPHARPTGSWAAPGELCREKQTRT